MGRVPANEEPGAGRRPLTRRSHPGSLGTGDRAGLSETSREPASERPPAAIRAACPLRGRTGTACRSVGGRPLGASHRLPARAASLGRGLRDEPPGAAAASSGRRGGSSPARSLALRGSQALEGMRVLRTPAVGAGS